MVRERGATFFGHKLAKAIALASAAVLLIGTFLFAGTALAQQVDKCPNGKLGPSDPNHPPPADPPDLLIDHECHVATGFYYFNNVNIISATHTLGKLIFDDDQRGEINFAARSIVVENEGSLEAGRLDKPFGRDGEHLHIVLYGKDQGVRGTGIICKSGNGDHMGGVVSRVGQCGIPNRIWDSNGKETVELPGGVRDRFYPYDALPFDDGKAGGLTGYFGYKVLAVSYGGSLKLFGRRGATYATNATIQPKDTGTSWVRLDGTITPGLTSLKVAKPVDWQQGDHIVVTTTDYLPNHSEELIVCDVGADHKTIRYTSDLSPVYLPCATSELGFDGRTMGRNIRSRTSPGA